VKEIRQQQPAPAIKSEPAVVNSRKLASNYDDYFFNIGIYNIS
jgi:hypothetical protein